MKSKTVIIILVIINVGVMLYMASAQTSSSASVKTLPIVRARVIELVDEKGQPRASIIVEKNGETVFRLRDAKGVIRVKLGASEDGSALVMLNNATEVGIHALAKPNGTTLTLMNGDGKKKIVEP